MNLNYILLLGLSRGGAAPAVGEEPPPTEVAAPASDPAVPEANEPGSPSAPKAGAKEVPAAAGAGLPRDLAAEMRATAQAIAGVLEGRLPERQSVEELFTVDLASEEAVMKRVAQLEGELAAASNESDPILVARRELAAARLRFLKQPMAARRTLLDADAERLRIEGQGAVASDAAAEGLAVSGEAEAEEVAALEAAAAAETDLLRRAESERARVARLRGEVARIDVASADEHSARLARDKAAVADVFALQAELDAIESGGEASVDLYTSIESAWVQAVAGARRDARVVAEFSPVPRYEVDHELVAQLQSSQPEIAAELLAAAGPAAETADQLQARNQQWALSNAQTSADREQTLFAMRGRALQALPVGERMRMQSLTADGVEAALVEWDHAKFRSSVLKERLSAWLMSPSVPRPDLELSLLLGRAGLAVMPVLAIWLLLRARSNAAFDGISSALAKITGRPAVSAAFQRATRWLLPFIHEAFDLVGIWLLARISAKLPFFPTVFAVVLPWAAYRLVLAVGTAHLPDFSTEADRTAITARVRGSIQLLGRYWIGCTVVALAAKASFGPGTLVAVIDGVLWFTGVVLVIVVARRWQDSLVQAFLRQRPDGRLAEAARGAVGKWYGLPIGIWAFLFLAGKAGAAGIRRFAMGFDQTRRVLAYLFRRRLERGEGEGVRARLSAATAARLRAAPVPGGVGWVVRPEGVAEWNATVAAWHDGARASVMVVGARGAGKSTWVAGAVASTSTSEDHLVLSRRLTSADAFAAWVAEALALSARDLDGVVDELLAGPRRMVVIEDVHLLFLRGVETTGAWSACCELVSRTGPHVAWVATVDAHAWEWMSWRYKAGIPQFRTVLKLGPWSEDDIGRLLLARVPGGQVQFNSLLAGGIEGVDGNSDVVGTEADFMRLIWDYADGNPTVALECWVDALFDAPDEEGVYRVALFDQVNPDVLEALTDVQRFVLGAVAWHGSLTAQEAQATLRFPLADCVQVLALLTEAGVLIEGQAGLVVANRWIAPVDRYLRRKHLLEAD